MGMLMIRCPKTGQAIFTGRYVKSATFLSTPVFFSRTHCPLCHATHEWFAKEAWVCDSGRLESEAVRELQVALLASTVWQRTSGAARFQGAKLPCLS